METSNFKINVKSGPGIGQSCEITTDQSFCFGRHTSNDCVLSNDPGISRQHFQVYFESGKCWIKDLESRNGTYLNDRRVVSSELKNHDEIRVGSTKLEVLSSDKTNGPIIDSAGKRFEAKTNLMIQNGETTTIVTNRKLLSAKISKSDFLSEKLLDSFALLPGRLVLLCKGVRNEIKFSESICSESIDPQRDLLVTPTRLQIQQCLEFYGSNSIILLNASALPQHIASKLKDTLNKFDTPKDIVNNFLELPDEIGSALLGGISLVLCETEEIATAKVIFDPSHRNWLSRCVDLKVD